MKKIGKYLLTILTITLFSELHFYPFQGLFRFSAGVLAISLSILIQDDLDEGYLGFLSGAMIIILRTFIRYYDNTYDTVFLSLRAALPIFFYYSSFGILAKYLKLRDSKIMLHKLLFTLFSIDILSNVVELALRQDFSMKVIRYSMMVAFIRSMITYLMYMVFKRHELLILKQEHQKRYKELNTIAANIQAETFYLKKSMTDIEDVMSKSYTLYQNNTKNPEISEISLDIAREVHEIKKDYYRILMGLEGFIEKFDEDGDMNFTDIVYIIKDNVEKYINKTEKNIDIRFDIRADIGIKEYYHMFTIINNLIVNSIDAINDKGKIRVNQALVGSDIKIEIKDDGKGIDEGILPYIFNPGFTTKFDTVTGEPSTGIGLSHIKNTVEVLDGTIEVEKNGKKGTIFRVSIPINSLRR